MKKHLTEFVNDENVKRKEIKSNRKLVKGERGITLIALLVTIIVIFI